MKFAAPAALILGASMASAAATPVKAPKDTCTIFQKAGLLNLDLLGCSKIDISILDLFFSPVTKPSTCQALQKGGLINLDILGCSEIDLSIFSFGVKKIAPVECSAESSCKVLQEGLINVNGLGCFDFGANIGKRAQSPHTSTTKTTTKATTTKATTTKATPSATPSGACNKQTCSILQKGGLINLNILGCSTIDVNVL
ncbi:unnamed protein product [Tilletia laevis]|uniref:Hydrophobin n=3 Tax=Tilletia TaxID=13289 RepID=A0A8X7MS69_9BASI|nr:hypothetical protein CF336_g4144 [Tilletia laevis]KAE8197183.1 hypothetical protein CF328_g3924 [Tilletia controversa]KAE8261219.1 hypothetical protein A4X03_0g3445 [Tilletia caries]KAE8202451.1 hypothetical protein CF335_g3410 [Tilletia laevis]KAE8247193.1 hypothetical protein A4X06_0g4630 [Tilletia controversa]